MAAPPRPGQPRWQVGAALLGSAAGLGCAHLCFSSPMRTPLRHPSIRQHGVVARPLEFGTLTSASPVAFRVMDAAANPQITDQKLIELYSPPKAAFDIPVTGARPRPPRRKGRWEKLKQDAEKAKDVASESPNPAQKQGNQRRDSGRKAAAKWASAAWAAPVGITTKQSRLFMGLRRVGRVLKYVATVGRLPAIWYGVWYFFNCGAIQVLTDAAEGQPLMEIALFTGLALIPFVTARLEILSKAIEETVHKLALLLERLKGPLSGSVHLIKSIEEPLSQMMQHMLYFTALNLFVNAVPDDFCVEVPKILRFLDANGDGDLSANEIEDFVYNRSSKVLSALLATDTAKYLLAAKQPPPGWTPQAWEKSDHNSKLTQWWHLTSKKGGWWLLMDRLLTAAIILALGIPWLGAIGIDSSLFLRLGGASGFAIGLAAQRIVGNGVSSLIILVTTPFSPGDKIEVGNADVQFHTGIVKEIGFNSTSIIVNDDSDEQSVIFVPNGLLLESPLKVFGPGDETDD